MSELPPAAPQEQEKKPNAFEQVQEFVRLSDVEREICATCSPENKEPLIEWYIREQDRARQSPDSRDGISLDIRTGVMQYIIAKDMEQRQEAFDRLAEAKDAAMGDGHDDLVIMADAVLDMLDSI